MDNKDIAFLAVGAAFVGLMLYIAYNETSPAGKNDGLKYQTPVTIVGMSLSELDTGPHYFHPRHTIPGQTQIWMRCRYPRVGGENISTLIHQGMSALNRPAPQDNDWITRPPAEVMF